MNKIKSFFKVWLSSLNPKKAKAYFNGMNAGKSIGMVFVANYLILLILSFFLFLAGFRATLHYKPYVIKTALNTIEYSKDILEHIPFSALSYNPDAGVLKFIGLPYNFAADLQIQKVEDLKNFVDYKPLNYKLDNNVLFIGWHNDFKKPQQALFNIWTIWDEKYDVPNISYEITKFNISSGNKSRLNNNAIIVLGPRAIATVTSNNKVQINYWEDIISQKSLEQANKDIKNLGVNTNYVYIPKSLIIKSINAFNTMLIKNKSVIYKGIDKAFINLAMWGIFILAIFALPILNFILFAPFGFIISAFNNWLLGGLLLASLGFGLAKLLFKQTSTKFEDNFKLGLLSLLTLNTYKAIILAFILMFYAVFGIFPSIFSIVLQVLFDNFVNILVVMAIMFYLKNLALNELKGQNANNTNKTLGSSDNTDKNMK